ncbi:aminotransferase class V-fold PLP-dependent enzyme [Blastococcus brunescens]|uniref:Aminotransferase class V-fold PLP-dependent enzyme n=1 Tax=Blastococcus brunescens TaxID=1564165 RepID=A0ABZ1B7P8_9ACTN|nr:aminotransferase class V-fold PLP-dependent enzyme [Blastococcus sp. BMG 8361]WRL66141.1 aminotransferase class V-fold PLP-dependent enzyme [Blastococcus sp. BMG 8361]
MRSSRTGGTLRSCRPPDDDRGQVPFPCCVEPFPGVRRGPCGPRSSHRLAERLRSQRLRPAAASLLTDPSGSPSSRAILWGGDRARSAHDSRAVPAARPRGGRLDRRLLVEGRRLPGPVAGLPGDVRAGLPAQPPEQPEPFSTVLADLERVVLPGVTHWQHPGFFGYFPANTSGPSVLGDLVSAGLGVQGMSWVTSPAATELEQHVMDWFADLLGLPASFRSTAAGGGVVQDSSSGANLVALLAALHRTSTGATVRHGVEPDRATVYVSAETHSSMEKAARIAGLGSESVRMVEVDGDLAMRPAALAARLERDVARGYTPVLVCATVGTTSTTAIDPLAELGPICQKYGVWLHVDAAYAGVSGIVPELRELQAGVEWADSYTTDAHKWLLTGFDASLFWVADRAALTGALSILPEYLRNAATDAGAVVDLRDWQIPLGRRFRALKLWFVLRWYGAEGLRAHIRSHVAMAQQLAAWAEADERFDVVAPTRSPSSACARAGPERWTPTSRP